jgi:hypothetical protein
MNAIHAALLVVTTISMTAGAAEAKPPNIIFIFSDDHAYQAIGAYGSKVNATPNIDRIARAGARFANSFVTNSLCTPSRGVIRDTSGTGSTRFRKECSARGGTSTAGTGVVSVNFHGGSS